MARFRALIASAAGVLALTGSTRAADMPEWAPPDAIRTVPVVESQGWYLRGDIGYRINSIDGAETRAGRPAPTDNRLDNPFAGGIGAGFKWGHLRTDLTADYGTKAAYTGTGGGAIATAHIQTITGLANVYYDIGTWWGATPYIGAGAGVAYVTTSDYQSPTTPPLSAVGSFSRSNIAWALMTGISYQVLPNLSVDAGYRFLSQGDAKTATDASGNLTLDKLQSHELRLGLRWMYDAPWAYTR